LRSLSFQTVVDTIEALRDLEPTFRRQTFRYHIVTYDTEGELFPVPRIMLLQALGAKQWLIRCDRIVDRSGLEPVQRALRFVLELLESELVLKVGSNLRADIHALRQALTGGQDSSEDVDNILNVFDAADLFLAMSHRGLYHQRVLQALGPKTGLGAVAYAHGGYYHKTLKPSAYLMMGGSKDTYKLLSSWQRIDGKSLPKIYRWKTLSIEQRLYCAWDTNCIFLLLIDAAISQLSNGNFVARRDTDFVECVIDNMLGYFFAGRGHKPLPEKLPAVLDLVRNNGKLYYVIDSTEDYDEVVKQEPVEPEKSPEDVHVGQVCSSELSNFNAETSTVGAEAPVSQSETSAVGQSAPDTTSVDAEETQSETFESFEWFFKPGASSNQGSLDSSKDGVPHTYLVQQEAYPQDCIGGQDLGAVPCDENRLNSAETGRVSESTCRDQPPKRKESDFTTAPKRPMDSGDSKETEGNQPAVKRPRPTVSHVLTRTDKFYSEEHAVHVRLLIGRSEHPRDEDTSIPVHLRYREYHKDWTSADGNLDRTLLIKRLRRRAKRRCDRTDIRRARLQENGVDTARHRVEVPDLVRKQCTACGRNGHNYPAPSCHLVRYQLGRSFGASFLWQYPCMYCHSLFHVSRMCPLLHGLCASCGHRGHRKSDHLGEDRSARMIARFRRFAWMGILTRKGINSDTHRWGAKPSQAELEGPESDEEYTDENDFAFPLRRYGAALTEDRRRSETVVSSTQVSAVTVDQANPSFRVRDEFRTTTDSSNVESLSTKDNGDRVGSHVGRTETEIKPQSH